jgi:hypothetical protein
VGEQDGDRGLILAGQNLIALCEGSINTAVETLGRRLATSKMANTTPECHLGSLSDVINAGIADEIYSRAPPLLNATFVGARSSNYRTSKYAFVDFEMKEDELAYP